MSANYECKDIDPDVIDDILGKVEISFDIRFVGNELVHITTLGQLCDHLINKIQLAPSDECTSQQAFYKLRDAIVSTTQLGNSRTISPGTLLADLLPKKSRRSQIKQIEAHIGFSLNILRPPHGVVGLFVLMMILSIIGLWFYWQIGLIGFILSITCLGGSYAIGKELDVHTVGQVATKMAREHYVQSRRNPGTYNKREIERIVIDWFREELDVAPNVLTSKATFIRQQ